MEVLRKLDVPSVEQAIAVPVISLDRVLQRSATRRPQKAEQLLEVPTEPGHSLGGTGGADRGQSSSSGSAGGVVEVFKVLSQYRIQQRLWSRSLIFQLAVEVFTGFRPGQGSTASSSSRSLSDADEGFQGVFRTFPQPPKKCEGHLPVESESARQCHLIRAERSSNGSCRGV